jgi:hypothetical protein
MELQKVVIAENIRRQEEAVQDGKLYVSCCGCGTGTDREPRKVNVHRWKPVSEDW